MFEPESGIRIDILAQPRFGNRLMIHMIVYVQHIFNEIVVLFVGILQYITHFER